MDKLTHLDVRKMRGGFRRTARGYDPRQVDAFLGRVADRLYVLTQEEISLRERTQRLEQELEEKEGSERTARETLVLAHKVSEDTIEKGRREADALREQAKSEMARMKAEAEAEIARRLEEVESELGPRKEALKEVERARARLLRSLRRMLDQGIAMVDREEGQESSEELDFGLEMQEWGASVEMPGEAGADSPRSERQEGKQQESVGGWLGRGGETGGTESDPKEEEATLANTSGEGDLRKSGAFDFMVTPVREESLPELFGRILDEAPAREGVAWKPGPKEEEEPDR